MAKAKGKYTKTQPYRETKRTRTLQQWWIIWNVHQHIWQIEPRWILQQGKNKTTKAKEKGKGKRKTVQCYQCGKYGHTSPDCWWKGATYDVDQQTPGTSLRNDGIVSNQQYQQTP
eukprot:5026990-Amphidinium_carterae.1